jgi:hypothetical protein
MSATALAPRLPSNAAERTDYSLATVALVAASLLVYFSGAFFVADVFGARRLIQVALTAPLALMAMYYWVTRPATLLDPFVGFVLMRIAIELVRRGDWIWVLDGVVSLFALTVILCAPRASFAVAVRSLVALGGLFATLGLLQAAILFVEPNLGQYGMYVDADNKLLVDVRHPIALLGLFSPQQYTLFGHMVARFQSFASEPSLNVVYFMLPAALAFLVRSRIARGMGCTMLLFCLVSLSGSVYLAMGFVVLWTIALWLVPMRLVFMVGMPLLIGFYIYAVRAFGLGPLFDLVGSAAQYGDFLNKGASLTTRANGAEATLTEALASPLGAATHPEIPAPWLLNSTLEAGWLGTLFLLWYLARLAARLEILDRATPWVSADKFGILVLAGAVSTVLVFNDYQMSNFTGIALMGFIYRQLLVRTAGPP